MLRGLIELRVQNLYQRDGLPEGSLVPLVFTSLAFENKDLPN